MIDDEEKELEEAEDSESVDEEMSFDDEDEDFTDISEEEELAPEERDVDDDELNPEAAVKRLQAENEELRKESVANYDKYLRALADAENYKKRAMKERSDLLKYQGEKVLSDVIDIVDDFERALEHADSDGFKDGINLIYKNLVNMLSKWQVKGESAVGLKFDPTKHNALSKMPSADAEPGTVLNELKKAYFYKDKLLRAADVVVAEAIPEPSPLEEASFPASDGGEDVETSESDGDSGDLD